MKPADVASQNQRRAADPGVSAFVTANAGSGKTKVLVDRIARLLLAGSPPASFLCITYTKAAANEMQRRLFERLGAWCVADDATLQGQLWQLVGDEGPPPGAEQLARARALFAAALETPGGLKIQTIHAFCERLLRRFPLEAGVAPGFEIAEDARVREILDRARASALRDGGQDFHAAFERFAARRSGEDVERFLNMLARAGDNLEGVDEAAIKARHGCVGTPQDIMRACLENAPWADLRAAITALEASSAFNIELGQVVRDAISARESASLDDAFAAYKSVFLTAKDEPRKREPTKSLKEKDPLIGRLFASDGECARVCEAVEQLKAIACAEDAAAALFIARAMSSAFSGAKRRAGLLDFADLITHAHALLSRADAAPWVLYKLDGGLDHILTDEGQDTSPEQWDVVAPLQQEFFAGVGAREKSRTVFAVGDPKQSIYGFQGADPERFLHETRVLDARVRASGRTFVAPVLETSFRTTPEVLRVVDAVCARVTLAASVLEQQNKIRHLASRGGEAGMVAVWPIAQKPAAAPAEPWDAPMDVERGASAAAILAQGLASTLCDWIKAGEAVWDKGALRPMHAGDVLVLVRKRGTLFHELIKAFKRTGLAVAGADRMVLRDELCVQDCLALMRVALDPSDDLSLACVLKGPWCGLVDDDEDLFPLAHGREKGETLLSRLMQSEAERYKSARSFVAILVQNAGAHPFAFLSLVLERVFDDGLTGWEKVLSRLGAEARDPLEELLARALKRSPHKPVSLQHFVREIEADDAQVKREMEGAGQAVRVMTVHGAKGLEAPVVLLPDTTAPAESGESLEFSFDESGPLVFGVKQSDDAVTRAARGQLSARALEEHWRLLYVAMTRARDRLIVCGAQHRSDEASSSWRLVVEQALASLPDAQTIETPYGEGVQLGSALQVDATSAAKQTDDALPDWLRTPVGPKVAHVVVRPSYAHAEVFSPRAEGSKRFQRGRLVHGLLQRLPEIEQRRRADAAHTWLVRQGVGEADAAELAQEALRVVQDVRFAALFADCGRSEVPIIGEVRGVSVRGVVDRLALFGDEVLLLDFKTDRPSPRTAEEAPPPYVRQMALYRAVLEQVFAGKAVRCALLWTEAPHLVALPEAMLEAAIEGLGRS